MGESDTQPTPIKSHSSKTNKSRPVCIRLPNDLFAKLAKLPKTETITSALTQYWESSDSPKPNNQQQKLLDFLIQQFIQLELSIEFPGDLETILMENITRLQNTGVI